MPWPDDHALFEAGNCHDDEGGIEIRIEANNAVEIYCMPTTVLMHWPYEETGRFEAKPYDEEASQVLYEVYRKHVLSATDGVIEDITLFHRWGQCDPLIRVNVGPGAVVLGHTSCGCRRPGASSSHPPP